MHDALFKVLHVSLEVFPVEAVLLEAVQEASIEVVTSTDRVDGFNRWEGKCLFLAFQIVGDLVVIGNEDQNDMWRLSGLCQDVSALVYNFKVIAAEPKDVGTSNVKNELVVCSIVHLAAGVGVIVNDGLFWQALDDVVVVREQADEVTDLDDVVVAKVLWDCDQVWLEFTIEHIARVVVLVDEGHRSDGLDLVALHDVGDVAFVIVEEVDEHVSNLVLSDDRADMDVSANSTQSHAGVEDSTCQVRSASDTVS